MARHALTTIAALMALAFCCALAPAADASSTLLSGYGGPGQGNQAILGSTLIGGGGGSSSSSGGDWGYVVLALLVLAMTAFATVLLTRGSGAGHDGPGEMGSN